MAVFLFSSVLHWRRAPNAWLPSSFTSLKNPFQDFDEWEAWVIFSSPADSFSAKALLTGLPCSVGGKEKKKKKQ